MAHLLLALVRYGSAIVAAGVSVGMVHADPAVPGGQHWRNASGFIAMDAETIKSPVGDRYRLLGYKAPKTATAECLAELDVATWAKRRVQELLNTGEASFVEIGRLDAQGRRLAALTVAGADIATILINERLARPSADPIGWCSGAQSEAPAPEPSIPSHQ